MTEKMSITVKHIIFLMLLLPFAAGCADSLSLDERPAGNRQEELPVELECMWPEEPVTRAFADGVEVKTKFAGGDVIHVVGTFKTRKLLENGEYEDVEDPVSRYGAFRYDDKGKKWVAIGVQDSVKLTWPSMAYEGTFKAYYISTSNGLLTDSTRLDTILLSSITPTSDPLEADPKTSIIYGQSVKLDFKHMCTHLTLFDLEPQVSESYWFERKSKRSDEEAPVLNNAFQIVKSEDEYGPTLQVRFFQAPDSANQRVYISGRTELSTIEDDSGGTRVVTSVGYFLQPGLYETFSLCYPAGQNTTYDYLEYDYNSIPESNGDVEIKKTKPLFEAGNTYSLTITKAPGVTIVMPPPGELWDEVGSYVDVEVEEFLKAIHDGQSYDYKNSDGTITPILEASANVVKLLHNVDFKYFNYAGLTFLPNIEESTIFDGGHHYIRHLGSSLFRHNFGTIRNLGIRDVKIDTISYESDIENLDMSRHGALCMWNRDVATIENVRILDSVEMTIHVKSVLDASTDGSEVHNIGCVIGSNTGKVREVALAGEFKLSVTGYEDDEGTAYPVNARVLIGGFVGQNAAAGAISDVSPHDGNLSIRITNACQGDIGSYSVGGCVGEASASISGISLSDVTIDGTGSKGVTSYMGGIAGQLASTTNSSDGKTASVESCIVSGTISAGPVAPYNDVTSGSYIGGIAGAVHNVAVRDCRTAVAVYGSVDESEDDNEGEIYATGGAFGRIRNASEYFGYDFGDLICYGSALQGPHADGAKQYIGNFAGIVPQGQTWEKDYIGKNIIVRKFKDEAGNDYNNIGVALDSGNNEND